MRYPPRLLAATSIATVALFQTQARAAAPGCAEITAQACVTLAISAMGGRQKLESVHSVRLDVVSHTALMEQSYRQSRSSPLTSATRPRLTS